MLRSKAKAELNADGHKYILRRGNTGQACRYLLPGSHGGLELDGDKALANAGVCLVGSFSLVDIWTFAT